MIQAWYSNKAVLKGLPTVILNSLLLEYVKGSQENISEDTEAGTGMYIGQNIDAFVGPSLTKFQCTSTVGYLPSPPRLGGCTNISILDINDQSTIKSDQIMDLLIKLPRLTS